MKILEAQLIGRNDPEIEIMIQLISTKIRSRGAAGRQKSLREVMSEA